MGKRKDQLRGRAPLVIVGCEVRGPPGALADNAFHPQKEEGSPTSRELHEIKLT